MNADCFELPFLRRRMLVKGGAAFLKDSGPLRTPDEAQAEFCAGSDEEL